MWKGDKASLVFERVKEKGKHVESNVLALSIFWAVVTTFGNSWMAGRNFSWRSQMLDTGIVSWDGMNGVFFQFISSHLPNVFFFSRSLPRHVKSLCKDQLLPEIDYAYKIAGFSRHLVSTCDRQLRMREGGNEKHTDSSLSHGGGGVAAGLNAASSKNGERRWG